MGRTSSMPRLTPDQLFEELSDVDDLLIVQDLDGVCMQLVKDPLTRRMDPDYVAAVAAIASRPPAPNAQSFA